MTVSLSSLRIVADLQAAKYVAAGRQVTAANNSMSTSSRVVNVAFGQTESSGVKASRALNGVLRSTIAGYKEVQHFQSALRTLARGLDQGAISAEQADASIEGLYRKYGLLANAQDLAAAGQHELAASVTRVSAALETQEAAADGTAVSMNRLAAANRNATMMSRQLSYQIIDIAQGIPLAFQSPIHGMQNFGFQIAQIGQLYMGQGGMRAAMRDMIGQVGRFAVKIGPAIAAGAAFGAVFAGMTYEINRAQKVTVGFGDTLMAVFQVLWRYISGAVSKAFAPIAPLIGAAWDWIVDKTKWLGNFIINSFRAAFADLKFIYMQLPNIIGGAVTGTANAIIGGIEWMINKAIAGINKLIIAANAIPDWMKPSFAESIPTIGEVSLGRFDNPYARALAPAWEAHKKEIADIKSSDPLGGFFQDVKKQAVKNALEDEKKKPKSEAEKMKERYDKLTRSAEQFIAAQEMEQQALFMTEEAAARLRYEQDLLNKAANDNIKLTPEQTEELKNLAAQMAAAEAQTNKLKEAFDFAKDTVKGFLSDFRSSLQQGQTVLQAFGNAFLNVLNKIIDKIEDELADAFTKLLFSSSSGKSGGGGFLGSIISVLGGLFGGGGSADPWAGLRFMASGGYTGDGGMFEPAGVVHRGEFVFSKAATERIGVSNLDTLHRTAKGYAAGGYVSSAPRPMATNSNAPVAAHITVSVNGARGNAEIEQMVQSGVAKGLGEFNQRALPDRVLEISRQGGRVR